MKLNVSRIMVLMMIFTFVFSGLVIANDQYMQYGVKMLKAKKYSDAVKYLNASIKAKPTSNAYYYLGLAYYGAKNKSMALRSFQMALKLNPSNRNAKSMAAKLSGGGSSGGSAAQKYLTTGHKYLKAKRYDTAIQYYKKSAQLQPTYQAYQFMGTAYYYKGDKANAKTAYQKSLQLNPNNPGVQRVLSKLGGSSGGGGEARLGEQLGVHPLLLAGLFAGSLAVLLLF